METAITKLLGVEAPILAFSHTRDVVAAVTNAGGFGVLGATRLLPDELESALTWIEREVNGKPFGVDLLMPAKQAGLDEPASALTKEIPEEQIEFVQGLMEKYGVAEEGADDFALAEWRASTTRPERVSELLEVAFKHKIKLLASALGTPPAEVIARAHAQGIVVAALAGSIRHAQKSVAAGADVIIATGYEAGGHTGEIGTMVLAAEVSEAIAPVPLIAAGGIVTGRQIAAALALGAAGVWMGSVWLTSPEAETDKVVRQKYLAAGSGDTIRSKVRTGKPARQLRSAWHDEWEAHPEVSPLPMPLQGMLSEGAFPRISKAAEAGVLGAIELDSYFVGQGVGMMKSSKPVGEVVRGLIEELGETIERLAHLVDDDTP